MFTLIKRGTLRQLFTEEGPVLLLALGTSEMFFKFHSFILESTAFLALWYVLGATVWAIQKKLAHREE